MKQLVAGLVALFVVVRCTTTTKEVPNEDITYTMREFRVESPGGCASDTVACAFYHVVYPEFFGLDSAVKVRLQQRIDESVSMGNPEAEGRTMQEIGDGFVGDYTEFTTEIPDMSSGWHYDAKVNVEVLTDTLISLTLEEEYYTGGAHGGYGTYFINLVPRTGAAFTLDAFLKPGYQEPLRQLGEKVFRRVRSIADSASLEENYFEFPDDRFQLNQNYGFKKEGIVFFYNSYEIAAYAAGPTEVLIPYEELREWIR